MKRGGSVDSGGVFALRATACRFAEVSFCPGFVFNLKGLKTRI